jgi:hypothetical protein
MHVFGQCKMGISFWPNFKFKAEDREQEVGGQGLTDAASCRFAHWRSGCSLCLTVDTWSIWSDQQSVGSEPGQVQRQANTAAWLFCASACACRL